MNRREFLQAGTVSAAALSNLQAYAFAEAGDQPLRVGLIGTGWYGKSDLMHLMQVAPVQVIGLCDVDRRMLSDAADLVATRQESKQRPPTYLDYRELLAKENPEIVIIGTPDHWHSLPMVDACKAGADVYVQKPISVDVVEGQAMVAAAKKYGSTVQVGLQRRSTSHLLEARERFLESGKVGKIGYVDIHSYFGGPQDFPADTAPPEHIDWERYVGPAPWRNYNPGIHPRRWRSFKEFGNGQMGDLCVHFFDLVRYFLKLGWPRRISANGGALMRDKSSKINTPDTQTAVFDYDDVQVVWNQRNWGRNPEPQYPWGVTLYGDKGTLKLSVKSYQFEPNGKGERVQGQFVQEQEKYPEDAALKPFEPHAAPATRNHMRDFLAARSEQRQPVSNIQEGYISSAACILANLSMELGRSLEWDSQIERVINDPEANERLTRPYRGDWIHPTPANV